MKTILTFILSVFALAASAQESDSVCVRMDFTANPWEIPACPYGLNSKGNKSWSVPSYEPEGSRIDKITIFDVPVGEGKLTMTLTPSDLDETDYDNAMVRDENYDAAEGTIETYLYAYLGSTMTFKAPAGMRMAKVAFNTYRTWASGSLYSGEATGGEHVWGPDSVQIRDVEQAGVVYHLPCWSGTAEEWSLPPTTSCTRLRYITFWLLPLADGIEANEAEDEDETINVTTITGATVRSDARRKEAFEGLPSGIYMVGSQKVLVK